MGEAEDKAARSAAETLLVAAVSPVLMSLAIAIGGFVLKTSLENGASLAGLSEKVSALQAEFASASSRQDHTIGQIVDVQQTLEREVADLQAAEALRERNDALLRPRIVSPN